MGKKGHCSVVDARASLDLFKCVRATWEPQLLAVLSKKDILQQSTLSSWMPSGQSTNNEPKPQAPATQGLLFELPSEFINPTDQLGKNG